MNSPCCSLQLRTSPRWLRPPLQPQRREQRAPLWLHWAPNGPSRSSGLLGRQRRRARSAAAGALREESLAGTSLEQQAASFEELLKVLRSKDFHYVPCSLLPAPFAMPRGRDRGNSFCRCPCADSQASDRPLLVDWFRPNCEPCKALAATLEVCMRARACIFEAVCSAMH